MSLREIERSSSRFPSRSVSRKRAPESTLVPQILVVEDDGAIAVDIKNALEGFGYSVLPVTHSCEDAIGKAALIRPDLVLMDPVLRGSPDGIETAEVIRARYDCTGPV